jgi:NAD(P)-dependent dehydrogenase (short-subunit alcohol dehydrogenase family)
MKLRDKVAVYCASKAAVISLTQRADLDLIKHGINVNAIAPRVVDNEHWDNVDSLFARQEKLAPRGKKAPDRRQHSYRPHGSSRGDRRVGNLPGQRGRRLYRGADL